MNDQKIGIISCGIGNVGSVFNMLKKVGAYPSLVNNPLEIKKFDKLILPGVGKFGEAMKILSDNSWLAPLNKAKEDGKKILGICIGMQLMCIESEESPGIKGLGWIHANVKKLPIDKTRNLRVPHMGWNSIKFNDDFPKSLFDKETKEFYFVHSFYVKPVDNSIISSETEHTITFTSSFIYKNLYGVQFHPEKSHFSGICLFKNFLKS